MFKRKFIFRQVLICFIATGILILQSCTVNKINKLKLAPVQSIEPEDTKDQIIFKAAHVVPTSRQMAYHKRDFIAFVHWGPNTFTRKEWGNGKEPSDLFNPQQVDTDQWCDALKAAGISAVVLTVKHHDGYCLWSTRYTDHSITQSPWENGQGDVLRNLSESCQKYGVELGVYLSPADLYQMESPDGLYGNLSEYSDRVIPRTVPGKPFKEKRSFTFNVDDYNEYFLNQLFELLTEYGPICEVWFDGAHPKRKGGQKYKYEAWYSLIRELAPDAVIFGKGPDVRWCGNEGGYTRQAEWNVIPLNTHPKICDWPDLTVEQLGEREQLYTAKYLYYLPAEVNTSIRAGWFYRDEKQVVRTVEDVFDMYERAVGGNAVFMLNIPPNREGLFSDKDIAVLRETGKRINDAYGTDLLDRSKTKSAVRDGNLNTFWSPKGLEDGLEIRLNEEIKINRFVIQEAIATHSQRIEEIVLEAWIEDTWIEIARGTTVGYKKILRFPEVRTSGFRLCIPKFRHIPTVAEVTAHYVYPQLHLIHIEQGNDGKIIMRPQIRSNFHWKHQKVQIQSDAPIHYTLDGSDPTKTSPVCSGPIELPFGGQVKARAIVEDEFGPVSVRYVGIDSREWKVYSVSSEKSARLSAAKAFDRNLYTCWQSSNGKTQPQSLTIDMGKEYSLTGFNYLPRQNTRSPEGMIEKGYIEVSLDGSKWEKVEEFEFGNLLNDPTWRYARFAKIVKGRYFRLTSTYGAQGTRTAGAAEIEIMGEK